MCSSWKVLAGVWAVSKCSLKACGTQCVMTFGTRRKHRWCVGSWAAGQLSPPWERPTTARAQAPSFWTMCSVRGLRPIWSSAPMPAGSPTTAGVGKMLVSPAWQNQVCSMNHNTCSDPVHAPEICVEQLNKWVNAECVPSPNMYYFCIFERLATIATSEWVREMFRTCGSFLPQPVGQGLR
ncbi:hypothetical protein GH733_001221 [Mirounga leonina]|nr:hypothetical protein GH733_001221 [Mirounga leonina]